MFDSGTLAETIKDSDLVKVRFISRALQIIKRQSNINLDVEIDIMLERLLSNFTKKVHSGDFYVHNDTGMGQVDKDT